MSRNKILVPSMEGKLDAFKMEVAKDMALEFKNLKNSSSPQSIGEKIAVSGNIGGEMVRRMIEAEEKKLID